VLDHPGPNGQIFIKGQAEPVWFASVRDTVAFTLLPEEPKDVTAIYVNDMASQGLATSGGGELDRRALGPSRAMPPPAISWRPMAARSCVLARCPRAMCYVLEVDAEPEQPHARARSAEAAGHGAHAH
jgi:hypothetical protein